MIAEALDTPFLVVGNIIVDAPITISIRKADLVVRNSEFIKKFSVNVEGSPNPSLHISAFITFPAKYEREDTCVRLRCDELSEGYANVAEAIRDDIKAFIEQFDFSEYAFDLTQSLNALKDTA